MINIQKQIKEATKNLDITNKAMLVSLSVSVYHGSKIDRKLTQEITKAKNANRKSVKAVKELIDVTTYINPIVAIRNIARLDNYKLTLPWLDDGTRILPFKHFQKYQDMMAEHQANFIKQVKFLIENKDKILESAPVFLGDLYDSTDYKGWENLEDKFKFDWVFLPFPSDQDFRVSIPVQNVEYTAKKIEDTLVKANKEAWNRLYFVINNVVTKLTDYNDGKINRFHDTLIDNIRDVLDILPGLNITDDNDLNNIIKHAKDKFSTVNPQALREDESLRNDTIKEANLFLKKMKLS